MADRIVTGGKTDGKIEAFALFPDALIQKLVLYISATIILATKSLPSIENQLQPYNRRYSLTFFKSCHPKKANKIK